MSVENPILIFGKTGQVGRALANLLGDKAVVAGRDEADFTKPENFAALVNRVQPSAIINAVAYTQVDKAEEDETLATQVNATAPAVLATLAKERGVPFVYYSTDYVFNGAGNAPFTEDMPCAALNAYGRSKRAGEEAIATIGGDYLIFRTSWVFDAEGQNFFNTMLRLAHERTELKVVGDQIGAPSYAPHLAQATMEALILATHQQPFPSGIYHMCNAGETSWHGFASEIFRQALDAELPLVIESCEAIPSEAYPTPAARPHNSRLNCGKLADVFDVVLPDWQEGVREALTMKMKQEGLAA